ncbi:hypothetical protein [Streptomyces sp. gb1(2016)]|uniref:Uncharacterized protein n=1 Tax=Streptomyces sp. gb1(2016) TaxID=1828321 RepID=A0A652L9M3_9ACTN|nr:hypothetical protein [Streptomyces sp. gb1(2016)]TXS31868.1 hypothetical protein EAO74_08030 [Streptomyces sp. gb1(2016)]
MTPPSTPAPNAASAPPLLDLTRLTRRYGSLTAVDDVGLRLPPGAHQSADHGRDAADDPGLRSAPGGAAAQPGQTPGQQVHGGHEQHPEQHPPAPDPTPAGKVSP